MLLTGTNTPVQPLSKLVQDGIRHIIPHLKYKARDTKHILQIIISLNNQWGNLGGIPNTAKQIACDVKKLYPSVENVDGVDALSELLDKFPNPDGLPKELIMEALKICLEENVCEFCGRFFKPNHGTAMGPCHACDYVDCFMNKLDEKLAENMEAEDIEHTGFRIFRDDGWDILINPETDLPKFEQILQELHPSIEWEIKDTTEENNHALEYLDLTITIENGRLETDIYAKNIPIYVPKSSCHPPHVGKSIIKSTAYRLNTIISKDDILEKRKIEYSRYFYASLYPPKMVNRVMDKLMGVKRDHENKLVRSEARENRENLINRPRKNKKKPGKKVFPLVTTWEPRMPNLASILKENLPILHKNPLNLKLFPEDSIFPGFRKRKNLGEIICPTKPRRNKPPARPPGGSRPCKSKVCQVHTNLCTTDSVKASYDESPT